ncbi:MAG TPA: heavy metal translocating P-type ATPase [Methylophilaceae bacterium]|nr:heavy metal translocating P-type ATPase [Methylophilaceae bacterium]
MSAESSCYHCGLPVLTASQFSVNVFGQARQMCCHGCQAVAESIVENGLQEYYNYRTELPKTAEELVPDELRQLALYDHPEIQKSFVLASSNALKEASLILEGITCAACIWLNERHLKQLSGVKNVAFNYASQRARISWDEREIKLSQILAEIRKLGYNAHPFSAQQQDALRQQSRKQEFKRLAVAGLSAAQVMMIAVALYAGPAQGLEFATAQLLRWLSLVMTIPAITYSAWPFYRAAWRGISNRRVGMDVPIVLGLITGFAGSAWATLNGQGVVYYDTITMLIFFLLGTRYLERNAREKSIEAAENLLRLAPAMATKLLDDEQRLVPVMELQQGDLILARPGETIAADGIVASGESSVDESLLTGESRPLAKSTGAHVFAGSINYESPLTISVTAIAEDTMLAGISRLLDRAQAEKPRLAEVADKIAAYFTSVLLIAVTVTALVWWQLAPERVLEIVLTVLVVSCPCALSLAAPAAFAAAGSHLVQRGVLLTRGHALEALAKVTHFVFDKTGTLTLGKPSLLQIVPYAELHADECLKLAASLEKSSEHPLAKSLIAAAQNQPLYQVDQSLNLPGQGVTGTIAGKRYSLGNARLNPAISQQFIDSADYSPSATIVWLSTADQLLAAFVLADQPRPQASELIQHLQVLGLKVSILSGDSNQAVQHFAQGIGVQSWQAALSPQDKLDQLRLLQQQGEIVSMVGDGINDAPVLAGAQVSIAMGSGTQMARATGDVVLLTENLLEISQAVTTSRFGISVIRQNFAWALGYNLIALPFAATGLISPWMAAIGMSVSSLIVVLNALRLR